MATDLSVTDDLDILLHSLTDSPIDVLVNSAGFGGFGQFAGVRRDRRAEARMMEAADVARIGVDGMFARRGLIVPGGSNRIVAALSRVVPHGLLAELIRGFNERKA